MAGERVQRRLTAIMAADVVGYSRMMGEDKEGTLANPSRQSGMNATISIDARLYYRFRCLG